MHAFDSSSIHQNCSESLLELITEQRHKKWVKEGGMGTGLE